MDALLSDRTTSDGHECNWELYSFTQEGIHVNLELCILTTCTCKLTLRLQRARQINHKQHVHLHGPLTLFAPCHPNHCNLQYLYYYLIIYLHRNLPLREFRLSFHVDTHPQLSHSAVIVAVVDDVQPRDSPVVYTRQPSDVIRYLFVVSRRYVHVIT